MELSLARKFLDLVNKENKKLEADKNMVLLLFGLGFFWFFNL